MREARGQDESAWCVARLNSEMRIMLRACPVEAPAQRKRSACPGA